MCAQEFVDVRIVEGRKFLRTARGNRVVNVPAWKVAFLRDGRPVETVLTSVKGEAEAWADSLRAGCYVTGAGITAA